MLRIADQDDEQAWHVGDSQYTPVNTSATCVPSAAVSQSATDGRYGAEGAQLLLEMAVWTGGPETGDDRLLVAIGPAAPRIERLHALQTVLIGGLAAAVAFGIARAMS